MELTLDRILPATIADGITQSEMACKDSCPMKWNLSYNNLLKLQGAWSWTLEIGSAIHEFLDLRYSGKEADPGIVRWAKVSEDVNRNDEWESNYEYWTSVIQGMQIGYQRHYKIEEKSFNVIAAEQEVTRDFMGITTRGKIDLRAENLLNAKFFMMDHKTTTRPELMAPEGWDMRFQFMFYSWLVAPLMPTTVFDFGINVIRKPSLRPTKNETHATFAKRCAIDYAKRPDFYFLREFVPISKGRIQRFEDTVLRPKLELYLRSVEQVGDPAILNRNTNNCHAYNSCCEFLPLCRDGDDNLFLYEQKSKKHEEL